MEDSREDDHFKRSSESARNSSLAGVSKEEDWEAAVNELLRLETPSAQTVPKESHSNGKGAVKQRGRGSFKYQGMGVYSDDPESDGGTDVPESSGCSPSDHSTDGDATYTLVLDCSANVGTKDVEEIVLPFAKEGTCTVRKLDNTKFLAVFSTKFMAREALVGIYDGRFKVSMADETDLLQGQQSATSERSPSAPRPASSAQVAQRMIVNALSRQGVNKHLLPKSQGSAQDIQKQERERKLRLKKRAQLRDEAWGSDDD